MKFNFNYKRKKFCIDVKECNSFFSKLSGLMFHLKSKPLLFNFNKKVSISIHSFFCLPFIAIWFSDERIINFRFIKSFESFIKPKFRFNKLLEVPINSNFFSELSNGLNLNFNKLPTT